MKFCKNLQRVVDISDPEWAPYWTNYKMLKKLIKELPSLVPSEDSAAAKGGGSSAENHVEGATSSSPAAAGTARETTEDSSDTAVAAGSIVRQHRGDKTAEAVKPPPADGAGGQVMQQQPTGASDDTTEPDHEQEHQKEELGRSPGERAFFKLLHAELKKATHFFDKAQQEFAIREERVREGMEIMKQPNSIMVSEKWSLLAKSIHRLYKDLLLLETFAIMTYCSFSKILKKHDKVTGYQTRAAFMQNVVNEANFTQYPLVLEMISRCERLYEEVSNRLLQEGKQRLYEDERLFINMISRLNEQVLNTEDGEGSRETRVEGRCRPSATKGDLPPAAQHESAAVSTLRSLVQEHDDRAKAAQVSEGHEGVDAVTGDNFRKRPAADEDKKNASTASGASNKRRK